MDANKVDGEPSVVAVHAVTEQAAEKAVEEVGKAEEAAESAVEKGKEATEEVAGEAKEAVEEAQEAAAGDEAKEETVEAAAEEKEVPADENAVLTPRRSRREYLVLYSIANIGAPKLAEPLLLACMNGCMYVCMYGSNDGW